MVMVLIQIQSPHPPFAIPIEKTGDKNEGKGTVDTAVEIVEFVISHHRPENVKTMQAK